MHNLPIHMAPAAFSLARWPRIAKLPTALKLLLLCIIVVGLVATWKWLRSSKPVVIPRYAAPSPLPPFPSELFIDKLYYLNLQHRSDRLMQIQNEFASVGWLNRSELVVAAAVPTHGAIGCVRSHLRALRRFLADPNARHALIVEDDLEFTADPRVNITRFLTDHGHDGWDVLMLASNTMKEEPYKEYAIRALVAGTTSAYAVTRAFAPKVIQAFEEGLHQLRYAEVYDPPHFAADAIWQPLQLVSRWYCLAPKVARQRPGFSDIEKTVVAYGV